MTPQPTTTVRVGAVDCGTNSIRLLVADVDPGAGTLTDLERRSDIVRLGYGVDRTGVIDPVAMDRTLAMCRTYAETCREHGVERVRFVATSASRDAGNAEEFVAGVGAVFADFGVTPEVVSGAEEAALSFRGATGALPSAGYAGPYLVVDLGGGSTELVRGTDLVEAAHSIDIGSVRLTERHLHTDPPTAAEVAAAVADVAVGIAAAEDDVPLAGVRTLVGVAGSITTVTAHALRLPAYDRSVIDLTRLTPEATVAACDELLRATRAERKALPYMEPGRVDVIGAGALVWRELVTRLAAEGVTDVVTSEHDILDGIALSVPAGGDRVS